MFSHWITHNHYIYIYIPIKPSKNHDLIPIKSSFHHYSTTISNLLLHRLGRGATLCRSAGKRAALGLELDMDWAWPGDVVTMVQWMGRRDILPENHAQMLHLGHIYIHWLIFGANVGRYPRTTEHMGWKTPSFLYGKSGGFRRSDLPKEINPLIDPAICWPLFPRGNNHGKPIAWS